MEGLKLEMSDAKTKITHTGDRARFLGYDITVSRSQNLKKTSDGRVLRSHKGVVRLLVLREKWVGKLTEYKAMKIKINENGKERFVALHRGRLVNQSDIEILARYNAEVRGLYNYYSIANDSFKIGRFANVMKYSMYKTFACKYKTNVHEIKHRYCKNDLYLADLNEQAEKRLDIIMEQMKIVEGVTEELKSKNQWEWVQKMNSVRYWAEEIVKHEMIYI